MVPSRLGGELFTGLLPSVRSVLKFEGAVVIFYTFLSKTADLRQASTNHTVCVSKGQIMSECIYEITDFPKYQRKNLIDFCLGRFYRLGTYVDLY